MYSEKKKKKNTMSMQIQISSVTRTVKMHSHLKRKVPKLQNLTLLVCLMVDLYGICQVIFDITLFCKL